MTRKLLISAAALLLGISTYVPLAKIVGGSAGTLPYSDGTRMVSSAAGSDTQTIRFNGTVPTPNSVETNDGTKVTITPASGNTALQMSSSGGPVMALQTTVSATNTTSSSRLGQVNLQGNANSVLANGAGLAALADTTWGAGSSPGDLQLQTTPSGSTTLATRFQIYQDGSEGSQMSGSALATNATGPFFFLGNMAGTPSGTPTYARTGETAIVHDTTGKKLWAVSSSNTWGGVQGLTIVNLSPSANSTTAVAATTDYEAVTTPASGTCTVTLPDAATRGPQVLIFRALPAGTVNLTIQRAGSDTINGGTTSITLTIGQSIDLIANGTDWQTLSSKSGTNATQP